MVKGKWKLALGHMRLSVSLPSRNFMLFPLQNNDPSSKPPSFISPCHFVTSLIHPMCSSSISAMCPLHYFLPPTYYPECCCSLELLQTMLFSHFLFLWTTPHCFWSVGERGECKFERGYGNSIQRVRKTRGVIP